MLHFILLATASELGDTSDFCVPVTAPFVFVHLLNGLFNHLTPINHCDMENNYFHGIICISNIFPYMFIINCDY